MLLVATDGNFNYIVVSADSIQQAQEVLDTTKVWPAMQRDLLFCLGTGGRPLKLSESVIQEDVRLFRNLRNGYRLFREG